MALPSLGAGEIQDLLKPYVEDGPIDLSAYPKLTVYLELILKWNARTNLTATRDPEEIVRRHFGECVFAARQLGTCETLLDFGSGAGFPGVPIQLVQPGIAITLAESQNKKATFLREAVRTLGLKTEVWSGRVEEMPPGREFEVVTMRAVDKMALAIVAAAERCSQRLVLLATSTPTFGLPVGFVSERIVPIPMTRERRVIFLRRCA